MSLLSGFNVTLPQVSLLGQAALAAFAGGAVPAGWIVITPQQLGVPSQYWDGNYFTNNGASAIVLQQGSTWIVSFRGTDGFDDVLRYPELLFGTYINHFQPLLNAIAANAPEGASFYFTGASLGGGAVNQMANIAGSQYGGEFASATFVAFASPTISSASGILNIGFENDPIYRELHFYADSSSSLDNLVLATSQYMQGNYDGLHPLDDYAHDAGAGFEAFARLQTSQFINQMGPDSIILFDAFGGTVQDITPGRENTGVFYLGESVADVIIGRNGGDYIEGFGGDDALLGGAGNDVLSGGNDNDFLDGNQGFDIAVFSGSSTQYAVERLSFSQYSVVGPGGSDIVTHIESLQFSDITIPLVAPGVDFEGAGLAVYLAMTSSQPSDATIANLINFGELQYDYGSSIGVSDPLIYMWQALGQALTEVSGFFNSTYGPITLPNDSTFVAEAYEAAFGFAPGQPQLDHFVQQVDYFESIYTDSGAYGTDAARIDLLARGAVYGQMLGISAEMDFLV
jgi:hypothetical protein